jgi:predicted RNA-binding Zn-ribbon protein involved in translation (DUF1610 family)
MANTCPECGKGELTLRDVKAKVSAAGLLGAFLAVIGVVIAFFNGIWGVSTIIVGILVGYFGRGRRTEALCPMCGYRRALKKT